MTEINIDVFKDSGLHDYEISDLVVNYSDEFVLLMLIGENGEQFFVKIDKFISFRISHIEEWGKGKYIYYSNLVRDYNNNIHSVEVQLNSGDEIQVDFHL